MALRVVYDPATQGQAIGGSPAPAPAPAPTQTPSTLTNLSRGVAKGELSTLRGLGTIGQTVLDQTAGRVVNAVQGKGFTPTTSGMGDIYRPQSLIGQKVTDVLKPQGTAENVGFNVEQGAEYLIPAFKAAKAERYIDILSKGITSPTAAAAYRLALKGGTQALASGAVKFAQTGGDTKQAIETGALAGGTRVALGALGETARAYKLPERFYQMIFKNAKTDMLRELNANGLDALQRDKPDIYKSLVENGIIKERAVPGAEAIANTIDQHVKDAQQVLANLPKERVDALGGVPKFMETFKKNVVDGLAGEGRTEASAAIANIDPSKFSSVDEFASAMKDVSTKISPTLNETTAEQALRRGLSGNLNSMANEVVGRKYETEFAVQKVAKAYKPPIDVSEPQFEKVLRGLAQEYQDVGFNELTDEANRLADVLKETKGKVPATTALEIRRLLDKFRFASSYDKPATSMSLSQANLKTLTDTLRTRINAIPGMGSLMKDYSFYIDALQDLSKEAARRGNSQVVSLIDSIFLGGSIGNANPIGFATAGIGRKLLTSPRGATAVGQAIAKSAVSPATSGAIGAASGAISPLLGGQQ